jgi:hypothetical protein
LDKEYDSWEHFCNLIFPDNPKGIIVVVTMYLDAAFKSYTADKKPLFHTLAGYAATVDNWRRFRKEWKLELDKKGIDHFHMTKFEYAKNRKTHRHEVHQAKNPFADLPLEDFDPMFERLARTLSRKTNGKTRLYSRASSIINEDFYAVRPDILADDIRCISPYVFNAYVLLRDMSQRLPTSEDIAYVFATGDEEIGQLHNLFLYIKKRPHIAKDLRIHWSGDNEVIKQSQMKEQSPIQAADILAYETQADLKNWIDAGRPMANPDLSTRRRALSLLVKYNDIGGHVYTKEQLGEEFGDVITYGKWML